jgi:small-conductance mechanosensitive channel
VLPNSFVLSNTTRNYSRATNGDGYILDVTVTIGYGTPWRQVHAMLLEAARRTQGVLENPPPYVIQTALSDFYVEYRLIAYAGPTAPAKRARAMSDLHANVQDVFNEFGVQIMSPHFMTEPSEPQVVPKAKWYDAPARQPASDGMPATSGADRKGSRP